MSNDDDLEKQLGEAMGAPAEPAAHSQAAAKSTSKHTLRTPAVVAPKEPKVSEPVPESFEEMKLRAKIEALKELLAEQNTTSKDLGKAAKRATPEQPPEEMVKFTVNLPVQATNIRVDGSEYYHGHTYSIRKSQYASFRDIQFNAWKHDEQVRGYRSHGDGYRTNDMAINKDGSVQSRPIY